MNSEDMLRIIERTIRNLSHEIKNPLTTIKGYTELLAIKSSDTEFVEKSQRMILQQADRIDRMLQDLYIAFLPQQTERTEFDAADTLKSIISSFIEDVRATAGPIPDTHRAVGNREALCEAIGLIVNGFDWKGLTEARCTLSMSSSGDRAFIDIRFEGIDIPEFSEPEFYLPFVFKRYYLKGTETYRAYFIARAGGWDLATLKTPEGRGEGFRIWV